MHITPEKHFEQQQKQVEQIFDEWRRNQNQEGTKSTDDDNIDKNERQSENDEEGKRKHNKRTREETDEAHRQEGQERIENNNLHETKKRRLDVQTEKQHRKRNKTKCSQHTRTTNRKAK